MLRPRAGADATQGGEGLYWRYDKWQKGLESAIGSIFAADGTLYAVRRALFVPIADRAQADDIAVSTRVVLQGFRLVFEPAAVAWEEAPAEGRAEFRRKVRVTNHSVRALLALGPRLWSSGFYSVELVSHKLLRHLVPFFLVALFVSNVVAAAGRTPFRAVLALQLLFYAAAVAGWLLRRRAGRSRLLTVPYYFCLVNLAALLGVLSIARGERLAAWTPRSGLQAGGNAP
jgi:cellulose synthase/poly-beta-1,6-N-acetylglucosamine synthase-like glycosyltransferase